MQWNYKKFEELTNYEIFEIFKARCAVFVVEQNCMYQDVDDTDLQAFHLFLTEGKTLVAYCRVYEAEGRMKIGRVLIVSAYRGKGLGREVMLKALDFIAENFPKIPIKIQAQSYLKNFYESFGFQAISDEYLDAGVPHIDMIKE